MGKFRGFDTDPGWINRELAEIKRQIRELSSAKRAQATTIGAGGLTVKDGGKIVVRAEEIDGDAVFIGPVVEDGVSVYRVKIADYQGVSTFIAETIPPQAATGGASVSRVSSYADVVSMEAVNSASVSLPATDDGLSVSPGMVQLRGSTGGVQILHTTTGAAANCFIQATDGRIYRSTSSLRYKQDVADAEVEPAVVLDMQPRTWRDKAEVEADPETETRYVGFIAEELHDLGLGQFVVYDADGDPEAIAYDRLSVALLSVLKDQDRRLTALEARLADEGATEAEEAD